MRGLVALFLGGLALADQSVPAAGSKKCESPPAKVVAEIERLLKSAGEHASHSEVCVDGNGENVTVQLIDACVEAGGRISTRYRVTTTYEVGGECSPYPDCAKAPPPHQQIALSILDLADGLLTVPRTLAGVTLRTPLGKPHSTGCHGKRAPFVPKRL